MTDAGDAATGAPMMRVMQQQVMQQQRVMQQQEHGDAATGDAAPTCDATRSTK